MRRVLFPLLPLLAVGLTAAAAEPAPFERDLPAGPVRLELENGRIEVTLDAGVQPAVRARVDPGVSGSAPAFELGRSDEWFRIARAANPTPDASATVTLEVALDPSQPLLVSGNRLSISVRSRVDPADLDRATTGRHGAGKATDRVTSDAASHIYEIADSVLFLVGSPSASIAATNTSVHAEAGIGDLDVQLERGSCILLRHRGVLQLAAFESDVDVQDLTGGVSFDVDGGNLNLSNCSGHVNGTVRSGTVSFDRLTGNVNITGDNARVEVRDSAIAQFQITGSGTDLTIDALRGSVKAKLVGGTMTSAETRGQIESEASTGARVEVGHHDGAFMLKLDDDSEAEIRGVSGSVVASLTESELIVENIRNLELTALWSYMEVADVYSLGKLDVRNSELTLDLRTLQSNRLDLHVSEGSSATVFLASPCRVQLCRSAAASQDVDITGCEFQMQNMGRWQGSHMPGLNGRSPFMLTAEVADSGTLHVRGGS